MTAERVARALGGGRMTDAYGASPIKRSRATAAEMEARAEFLIDYAEMHGPVTVRGLYYQGEVARLPGIDKSEASYSKVQRQVLALRRAGRLSYHAIADASRWMRKPRTFGGLADLQETMAQTYRRALWAEQPHLLEIWCEKSALAGVIYPVTSEYDVPLMVTGGYPSETFAFEAIANYAGDDRPLYVYALYDFDRSGQDAARSLEEKLTRFGRDMGVEVCFTLAALTAEDVERNAYPTRTPKRNTPADKAWPYPFACELDAMPPADLRATVEVICTAFLPAYELARLREIEALERETIAAMDFTRAAE